MSMKNFYGSSFIDGLAQQLIIPFIPIYALTLGASKYLIGLVSSLPTFASVLSQIIWGCVSESTKNKKALVILGGILWSLLWIPVAFTKNIYHLILLLVLQSIFSAATIPAWTFLLVQLTPKYKRGKISGNINSFTSLGGLIGSLVAGYILNRHGFVYFIFLLACVFGIVGKLIFLPLKEPVFPTKDIYISIKSMFSFKELKENKKLLNLTKTMLFFNFSVAIAGPFFSLYIVQNLGGSLMDVALISAIGIVTNLAFYRSWGTLVDYLGAKTVMIGCLVPIAIFPFVYAIANNVFWIYLYSILGQIAWAGFNVASFVYLSNSLPKENSVSSVGMFNTITQLGLALSPFLGGFIADFLGIRTVLLVSTALRLMTFRLLYSLEEKTGLKLKGIFKTGRESFGLINPFETFVYTYSMLVERMSKSILTDMKRKKWFT